MPSPAWLDTSAIHGYALSRDAGVCDAINAGWHSITAVANVLGLSVSRVSRIVRKMMDEAIVKS